jgi:Tfp pilus assembly protein PilN
MPQQINLCTPILLTQKRYFSAQTMAATLGVFVVLGGILCAAWVWSLDTARQGYLKTMDTQAKEIESLQAAIRTAKAGNGQTDASLVQQLQSQRLAVQQSSQLLQSLQDGVYRPGAGHSDRLALVSRSIPDTVWVTQISAEAGRFELAGATLEPAALNEWVARLAQSPLLRGLELSQVKVERVESVPAPSTGAGLGTTVGATLGAPGQASSASSRPTWNFSLQNVQVPTPASTGGSP